MKKENVELNEKKEFLEPEVNVFDFELETTIADTYLDSEGWIIDPENPWH